MEKEDGADKAGRDPGDRKWVRVHTLPSRLYADQVKDILGTEGIPVVIKGDDVGIFGPGAGYGPSMLAITVWVPENFKERAKELIVAYLDGV
jgi:hypothetical protein